MVVAPTADPRRENNRSKRIYSKEAPEICMPSLMIAARAVLNRDKEEPQTLLGGGSGASAGLVLMHFRFSVQPKRFFFKINESGVRAQLYNPSIILYNSRYLTQTDSEKLLGQKPTTD